MIKTVTKEVIKGSMKMVENIRYSNGKRVRRVLDPKTLLPVEIIDVKA